MTEADQHALKQMTKNIEQRFNIEVLTMQVQRSTSYWSREVDCISFSDLCCT
jgi:hypothetical protein